MKTSNKMIKTNKIILKINIESCLVKYLKNLFKIKIKMGIQMM